MRAPREIFHPFVTSAEAGAYPEGWIPSFAGMTRLVMDLRLRGNRVTRPRLRGDDAHLS